MSPKKKLTEWGAPITRPTVTPIVEARNTTNKTRSTTRATCCHWWRMTSRRSALASRASFLRSASWTLARTRENCLWNGSAVSALGDARIGEAGLDIPPFSGGRPRSSCFSASNRPLGTKSCKDIQSTGWLVSDCCPCNAYQRESIVIAKRQCSGNQSSKVCKIEIRQNILINVPNITHKKDGHTTVARCNLWHPITCIDKTNCV